MTEGVKFCGVMNEQDIMKAERAGATAVGVIVRPNDTYGLRSDGSRSLDIESAASLVEAIPDSMDFVLLPNTADYDEIVLMTEEILPDRLQIGKAEDPVLTASLRDRYKGEVNLAQVIHVGPRTRAEVVDPFIEETDFIHLDTQDDDKWGGTGRVHDWRKSRAIAEHVHEQGGTVILAGGLTVSNVAEAIATVKPDGVDAESANRKFGVYNQKQMEDFVRAAA